jgi:hypothetical protein
MEFREYDFSRSPVVQNEDFFLESNSWNLNVPHVLILARSIDGLVEQEAAYRTLWAAVKLCCITAEG